MIKNVYLWKVGRNINRAVRTSWSFGVEEVHTIDCGDVSGNLFQAKNQKITQCSDIEPNTVFIEVNGDVELGDMDWRSVESIAVGGENVTLPSGSGVRARLRIPTAKSLCLTTEAALAIALHRAGDPHRIGDLRYCGWGCWSSSLPNLRRIELMAQKGIKCVLDLTQRDRNNIQRWCNANRISYHKSPVSYDGDVASAIYDAMNIPKPFAVHCFHGRDRTGRFLKEWEYANSVQ